MDEIYVENDRWKELSNAKLKLYIEEHREIHRYYIEQSVIAMNLEIHIDFM